jgi:hypothetical protein
MIKDEVLIMEILTISGNNEVDIKITSGENDISSDDSFEETLRTIIETQKPTIKFINISIDKNAMMCFCLSEGFDTKSVHDFEVCLMMGDRFYRTITDLKKKIKEDRNIVLSVTIDIPHGLNPIRKLN